MIPGKVYRNEAGDIIVDKGRAAASQVTDYTISKGLAEEGQDYFNPNIFETMTRRINESEKVAATTEFIQKTHDEWGVPMDKIGTQLMGAVVWILGLSLIHGGADWIQSSLNLIKLPKLIFALITWMGCLILIIQRRRHQMSSARFARISLIILIPAMIALWLSLPASPK